MQTRNSTERILNWCVMRTKILYIVLSALMLAGCVPETPSFDTSRGGIILNIVVEEPQTKDTPKREGIDALNENLISDKIDIFFYDESTLWITKEALGVIRSGNLVQIETNPNEIEDIFGTIASGAHCGVFVVANFIDDSFDGTRASQYQGTPGNRTLTEIKSSLLPAPTWETLPQAKFVMTGEQQVTLQGAQSSTPVYATIGLERVAAKVTFDVTVSQRITGGWTPDTRNMSVYMVYAMRKATLGATPVEMPTTANVTYEGGNVVYSQYVDKVLSATGANKERMRDGTPVSLPVYSTAHQGDVFDPFYTYPCTWETGSSMEPYMKLIIPWTYENTTRKYYYKIPFHGHALERNHWYHLSIDVQILGTEQAEPPEVAIHYTISDWSGSMDTTSAGDYTSATSLPATVITAKFLNVPTTEYILYDEEELTIPIQSSHDVEVVGFNVDTNNAYKTDHMNNEDNYIGHDVSIYNPFLNTLNESATNAVRPNYQNDPPTPVVSATGWSITVNGRTSITIQHALNRNLSSSDFDVAPYTLRLRIRHTTEKDNYYSDVIIEQRPSIIIRPQHNSDYGDILPRATGRGTGHTTEDGYVFINGVRTNTQMNTNRTNTNFNMYIVETSVLPTEGSLSDYVLGDPRQSSSVNSLTGYANNQFTSGVDIAGGSNRKMANYYPAAEDDDHKFFVAPSFRIASSFGTSGSMVRNDAVYRCAVYQEDGYPAGRWRLPTEAEVFYMITLSQKGKIPTLFSPEDQMSAGGYWSANGVVFPLNSGAVETCTLSQASNYNSGKHWTRCVYDEWFWSDTAHETASKTDWTWGDEARNTVVKQ